MRTIKFRQALYRNGKFYKFKYWGFGLIDEPKDRFFPPVESAYEGSDMSIDINQKPEESNQFTGLKDKNGKEIYEGDICTFPESPTNKTLYGVIEFKDSAYRWIEKPVNGIQPCVSSLWRGNLEIIGNIYENPDLIKG